MKLSTRSRYGLRAVVELARRHGQGTTNMQEIADRQAISRKYLDTLFSALKVAGLVHSRRGLGGGWELTRPPEQIHLADVFRALEGSLGLVPCVEYPQNCERAEACVAREIYVQMHESILAVLARYTLADAMDRQIELDALFEGGGDRPVACLAGEPGGC